jgi:hypothetical protein
VLGIAGVAFWVCRKRTDKPENGPAEKGAEKGNLGSSEYGLLPPSPQHDQGRLQPEPEPDYGRGRISTSESESD